MATVIQIIGSVDEFEEISPDGSYLVLVAGTPTVIDKSKSKHFQDALNAQINLHLDPYITKLTPLGPPILGIDRYTQKSLVSLLCNLDCYAPALMTAFCTPHFFGDTPSGKQHTNSYTTQFALNAILQQVEMDAQVFSGIYQDRLNGLLDYRKYDDIANDMIESAVQKKWFDSKIDHVYKTPFKSNLGTTGEPRPVPLVYFGRTSLRTVPYSPVAPIQLPIDIATKNISSQDDVDIWIKPAIAQEVGKLIFWKGSDQNLASSEVPYYYGRAKFSRYLALKMQSDIGIAKWVANGLAGIFADVFMTLYCDLPALGYAICRAQTRKLDRFQGEDLRYQLPSVLRPFVCFEVLKKLYDDDGRSKTEIDELKTRWNKILKSVYGRQKRDPVTFNLIDEFEFPVNVTIYSEYGNTTIGFEEAVKEVERAALYVYELVKGLNSSLQNTSLKSSSSPDPNFGKWQDGTIWMLDKTVEKADGSTPAGQHTDSFFLEGWFSTLSTETMINARNAYSKGILDSLVFNNFYIEPNIYWSTALYSGGWMMESPGNTGGPH